MKKLFAILALVLGMVSCQNEPEALDVVVGGEQEVMLNVSIPEGTRANSAEGFDLNNLNGYKVRYILEISYNGNLIRDFEITDATTTKFPVRLAPNRDYTFTVWADIVEADKANVQNWYDADLYYNTANGLANIYLQDWTPNVEARDAWTATKTVTYTSSNKNISLELKRPFAKVRVVATDIAEIRKFGLEPAAAVAEYAQEMYTEFDAVAGKAKGATTSKTLTFNYDDVETYEGTNGDQLTVFADYVLVPADGNVQFTLSVYANEQRTDLIKTNNFNTTIPVVKNKVTTIKGNVLTDGGDLSVDIENGFDTPDDDIEVISGNKTEEMELTEGTYLFGDVTFNVAEDAAIVVKSGNVVIDLMEAITINAPEGIVVEEGATLTINGLADTRSSNRAGKLVVKATNGSAISGNVTINNLAGLTAIGKGDHAFGIGGPNAEVTINNTKVDYVAGGHIQPLFVNDTKYGKSEPEGGAAIGGKKVVIENSEIVKADGGSKAAAIGNSYWNSTEVVIKNSELGDIFGGNASAAIGGSRYSSDKTTHHSVKVAIENSTITNAVGGQFGAGIGSGYDTHCYAGGEGSTAVNDITIKNSTVTAQGGQYAAGIGTGFHVAALSGSIDAASTINATAGAGFYKNTYTYAQNIGYGIVDPAREFANGVVRFTVANETIDAPKMAIADGVAATDNEYAIYNANGLKWLATTTNGGTDFGNKTIKLMSDIDLKGEEWTPIGVGSKHFKGTFDGQGHIINGLKISQRPGASQAALFGTMSGSPTIKNLVIEGANVKYPKDNNDFYASAVAGTIYGYVTFENITIKNSTITGNNKVGAIFAHDGSSNKITVNNCHVDKCYIASEHLTDGGNIGGLIGYYQTGTTEACKISNSSVKNSTIVGINSSNSGKRANSEFIGSIHTKANTNLVLENCVVENNTFSQTIDGTAAVTYVGAFPAQFIGGDRNEECLGIVVVNGTRYDGTEKPKSVVAGDGSWYATVGDAITAGNTSITLGEGNFEMPDHLSGGAVIEGNGEETVLNMDKIFSDYNNVTFRNLTINAGTTGWKGLQHSENIAYDNCTINGQYFLYTKSTFTNCTFNIEGDAYNIWTWSAPEIKFEGCTFNCDGKALLVYHESDGSAVECVNCTFNSNGKEFDGKAAIEIDGTLSKADAKHVVTINNCEVNGFAAGNVSGNNIYNVKKGNKAEVIINGTVVVYNASSLASAINGGKNIILGADIALCEPIQVNNKTFSLDGNGYKIGQSSDYPAEGTKVTALLHPIGCTATIKNLVFDSLKVDGPIRSVDTKITIDNVTVTNCERRVTDTTAQGLFRLHGESTITNCIFKNNVCPMCISFNWDGNNNLPQAATNCVFESNECISTAVVYYVKGSGAIIDNNKFVGNTVTVTGSNNAATLYMGFTENNVITNNLFQDNSVKAGTSKRVAGGLMIGYAANITGNAFIGNTVTAENAKGNDVCASVYYTDIDLSGNYWGGNAPIADDDYFVEYPDRHIVTINDYLTVNPIN